jgi:hypothetical protein
VLCSVVAALTLAAFALVSGRAERRRSDAARNERRVSAAPFVNRRARRVPLTGGSNGADPPLPIEQYDALRVAEILPRLRELTTEELRQVHAWEAQRRARVTILARIDALLEKAAAQARPAPGNGQPVPIEGYDNLTVAKILPVLSRLGPEELDAIAERERSGAGRRSILVRISSIRQRSGIAP